jgi:hypothetical protein
VCFRALHEVEGESWEERHLIEGANEVMFYYFTTLCCSSSSSSSLPRSTLTNKPCLLGMVALKPLAESRRPSQRQSREVKHQVSESSGFLTFLSQDGISSDVLRCRICLLDNRRDFVQFMDSET